MVDDNGVDVDVASVQCLDVAVCLTGASLTERWACTASLAGVHQTSNLQA
jgi:hypothetical protein